MTITAEWSLPALILIHKPFVILSLLCPAPEEVSDRVALEAAGVQPGSITSTPTQALERLNLGQYFGRLVLLCFRPSWPPKTMAPGNNALLAYPPSLALCTYVLNPCLVCMDKENNTGSSALPCLGKQSYRLCSQGGWKWPSPCFLYLNMAF